MLLLQRVLDGIFARCDVVVQTEPFPFDMIGLPLIGFPVGFEAESAGVDLPVGAMLGGQHWAEDRLLSLVAAYQSVTDWHLRRPPDPVDSLDPADTGGADASDREWEERGGGGGPGGHGGGAGAGDDGPPGGPRDGRPPPALRFPADRGRIDASEVMDLTE